MICGKVAILWMELGGVIETALLKMLVLSLFPLNFSSCSLCVFFLCPILVYGLCLIFICPFHILGGWFSLNIVNIIPWLDWTSSFRCLGIVESIENNQVPTLKWWSTLKVNSRIFQVWQSLLFYLDHIMKITSNKVCSYFEAKVSAASSFPLSDSPTYLISGTPYCFQTVCFRNGFISLCLFKKNWPQIVFPFKAMTVQWTSTPEGLIWTMAFAAPRIIIEPPHQTSWVQYDSRSNTIQSDFSINFWTIIFILIKIVSSIWAICIVTFMLGTIIIIFWTPVIVARVTTSQILWPRTYAAAGQSVGGDSRHLSNACRRERDTLAGSKSSCWSPNSSPTIAKAVNSSELEDALVARLP